MVGFSNGFGFRIAQEPINGFRGSCIAKFLTNRVFFLSGDYDDATLERRRIGNPLPLAMHTLVGR